MKINSGETILLAMGAVTFGFIWASFYPNAPYDPFIWAVVGLAGGNLVKRTVQKSEKYSYTHRNDTISGVGCD